MTKGIEWTSEMVAELKRLMALEENLSFNVISKRMSKTFNLPFTRNSTVGKAHRLKMPPRPPRETKTAENTHPRNDVPRVGRPAPITPPPPVIPIPPPYRPRCQLHGLELVDLRARDCRYPSGSRPPYTYCGKPIVEHGASYCLEHYNLVHVKPRIVWK